MRFLVTLCERDYRGERMIFSEPKTDVELNILLGMLLRAYGSAKEVEPGYLVFKGSYQAAHGGQESNGATIEYDPIDE